MTSFEQLARSRESCRAYDPSRHPSREVLEQCVRIAQNAPSACNSQPWSVVIANSERLTQAVAPCLQTMGINGFASECPAFFLLLEEQAQLIRRVGAERDSQFYAQMDVGIAAAHICLAAEDLGISTCIIGSFDEQMLRDALELGGSHGRLRLVIAAGYAAREGRREKVRKPLGEILTYLE